MGKQKAKGTLRLREKTKQESLASSFKYLCPKLPSSKVVEYAKLLQLADKLVE